MQHAPVALLLLLPAAAAAAADAEAEASCAAGDDAVSFIQRRHSTSIGGPYYRHTAFHMDWHLSDPVYVAVNNLGGMGPHQQVPREMRFHNVSTLHSYREGHAADPHHPAYMEEYNMILDLLITAEAEYDINSHTYKNGAEGDFGYIYVKAGMTDTFRFSFVNSGTYEKVLVPEFDFTIFDLDQASTDHYCDEMVTGWGVKHYAMMKGAYSDVIEYDPDKIMVCSNTQANNGWIPNPTSLKQLSLAQARSAIMFSYENTSDFLISFTNNGTGPRPMIFAGTSDALDPPGGSWHEHFSSIRYEALPEGFSREYFWHLDKIAEVVANNLGGRGPNYDDPREIRYRDVGLLHTYDDQMQKYRTDMLDLVVMAEGAYWGSEYINANWNGANGEYGEIGLGSQSNATFKFTFVKTGTYFPVVVPKFGFTIYDIDNQADPALGEEYIVHGASAYSKMPDAFTIIDSSVPGQVHLTSNVRIHRGAIPNPVSMRNLTEDQARASVQFEFRDTAVWTVDFRITSTYERAFLFGGIPRSPLDEVGVTETVPTPPPTPYPTAAPTVPTPQPTIRPTPPPTPPPTPKPTGPTPTPTASPTVSPTFAPTAKPTPPPTPKPTSVPTTQPTRSPTASPTTAPTTSPTMAPTTAPTTSPTMAPTTAPTTSPTTEPTGKPTPPPTPKPTTGPTLTPTASPTVSPTPAPTAKPTPPPTPKPTSVPTTSPTKFPTASPTTAPTTSPTTAPTGKPTQPPTPKPTIGPTATPTVSPTVSPTLAPTAEPTPPPTPKPTSVTTTTPTKSPTASPTTAPTASPTVAPTGKPTTSPTLAPTASPTFPVRGTPSPTLPVRGTPSPTLPVRGTPTPTGSSAPTLSPTGAASQPGGSPAPTRAPTPAPAAETGQSVVFGDPHVSNIHGARFDIQRAGSHAFAVIPRGAAPGRALLEVHGQVDTREKPCKGQLYLTRVFVTGAWLGAAKSFTFRTQSQDFNTPATFGLEMGKSGNLSLQEFFAVMPRELVEAEHLWPARPTGWNKHVTTLRVKVRAGPATVKVTWEHQKETAGYSNSLTLIVAGLSKVGKRVGGLLGEDDHSWAASKPYECFKGGAQAASILLGPRSMYGRVRAIGKLSDE